MTFKNTNHTYTIFGILLLLMSCKSTQKVAKSGFQENDEAVNLYAFIGEKIAVMEFDPNENNTEIKIDSITGDSIRTVSYVMDHGFKNTYKVVQNVFNDLKTETIEFVAYDHYGRPGFENYDYVLLYLSLNKEKGYFYHQKYQFDPVQKTKKGTWKGSHGESIEELFNQKKKGVFTAGGLFDK